MSPGDWFHTPLHSLHKRGSPSPLALESQDQAKRDIPPSLVHWSWRMWPLLTGVSIELRAVTPDQSSSSIFSSATSSFPLSSTASYSSVSSPPRCKMEASERGETHPVLTDHSRPVIIGGPRIGPSWVPTSLSPLTYSDLECQCLNSDCSLGCLW